MSVNIYMQKFFLLLLLIIFVSSSQAQQDSAKVDSVIQKTILVKAAYVVGASLAFSLFDYVGYNLIRHDIEPYAYRAPWMLPAYRILQVAVQSAITYFLYKECGLSSAISFNLIWWTWGDDLAYYGLMYYGSHSNAISTDEITWAGWTPIGLTRRQGSIIPQDVLIPQAIVGFSISMAILQF